MEASLSISQIPADLHQYLPKKESPWQINQRLLERIQAHNWEAGEMRYKKCLLSKEDPECAFILKYFNIM